LFNLFLIINKFLFFPFLQRESKRAFFLLTIWFLHGYCLHGTPIASSSFAALAHSENGGSATGNFPPVRWLPWDEAYKEARSQKKMVLIDLYTDWCGWCKKLDKETFENPYVTAYLDSFFVSTKINPELPEVTYAFKGKSYTGKAFFSKLADDQAGVYPTLIIIIPSEDPDFDKVYTLPGYFAPMELLSLLKDIRKRNP
jgi:thioredoxin-related protein